MSPSARPFLVLLGLFCLASQSAVASRAEISAICDSAAIVAARESGVPVEVLRAISLTETGRKLDGRFMAWPWTVNMEGLGKWFDDVGRAQTYVDRHFERGARSFDVGCFQINYKWHGHAFVSIEEMFDPIINARYAAKFLGELYAEFGDWSRAAGAYHSRTPKYAKRYMARFDKIRSNLQRLPEPRMPELAQAEAETPPKPIGPKSNRYPFLIPTRQSSGASLVPSNNRRAMLFGGAPNRPLIETR